MMAKDTTIMMGEYNKPEGMEYKVQVTVNPDEKANGWAYAARVSGMAVGSLRGISWCR